MGGTMALIVWSLTTVSTARQLQSHSAAVAFADHGVRLGHHIAAVPETGVVRVVDAAPATPHPQRAMHAPSPAPTPSAAPAPAPAPAPPPPPAREVLGFAPAWTLDTWPEWRMQDLSTIAYFAVTVDGNGNTVGDQLWPTWQSQELTDMVNAAHAAHVRVLVTVSNFDEDQINSMLTDAGHMATAVQTAVDLVRMRGLDGVVVDFEGTADADHMSLGQGLTQYVSALHARLKAYRPDAELVVATYAGSAGRQGGMDDIRALTPVVDAFFVMAYDMAGANTPGRASANAPLNAGQFNDTAVVQQYLTETTADKLILGVPYYGTKWSVTSPDANAATTSDAQPATYAQMYEDFSCAQSLAVHKGDATPWATWYSPPNGDPCGADLGTWREMYFETPATIAAKYDLVDQSNLRGTGMWALGFDSGHTELWDVLGSRITARR
jgi:spore germination protein YaaH